MKDTKYSRKDSKGLLWVACSECDRGGNGSDVDKCTRGWKIKRGGTRGCFLGALRHDLKLKE